MEANISAGKGAHPPKKNLLLAALSEADYQESKRAAQAELVPVLSLLEELNAKKLRDEVTPPPGFCARCSHVNPDENTFCGSCGAPLKKKKR